MPDGGLLNKLGLPAVESTALPSSAKRFPDGAEYRVEIPSTEGAACLRAALDTAAALSVPVHRVSQGSGVFMLDDAELSAMVELGAGAGVEVCLFAKPNASWDASATAMSEMGALFAGACRGQAQLAAALADVERAAAHGVRSVLISDLGLLAAFGKLRAGGDLPATMRAKVSASFPVTNAATVAVLADLGADTVNVAGDLALDQLAAMRAATDLPFDLYVESPAGFGGFLRLTELPEIVRVAAPVYLKFGIRNAPDIYPTGGHLAAAAETLTRERVRRARLGLDLLARSGSPATASPVPAPGAGVPVPSSR